MGTIKTQCSCGMLWLSETLGGYDTICDHDGKICSAVNYQDGQFKIIKGDNRQVFRDPDAKAVDRFINTEA